MLLKKSPLITNLEGACQLNQRSIAFPESADPRIVQASLYLAKQAAIKHIFFFSSREFLESELLAQRIEPAKIIEKFIFCKNEKDLERKTFQLLEENQQTAKKKLSREELESHSKDPLYQAGFLLKDGACDVVLAGATHTTSDVIRAALRTVGLDHKTKTVSGAFVMEKENSTLIFTDCGVLIDPTSEQIADNAYAAAKFWAKIYPQIEAKIAFLSFSTHGSASHPLVEKVKKGFEYFKEAHPHIACDGELQFDAAVCPEVRKRKTKKFNFSGPSNIYVFPDLNSGNIGYKMAQYMGGYEAYGPILLGLEKPYSDLSRGASVSDIIVSSYLNFSRTF